MGNIVFLGLGSNLGDREKNLHNAMAEILKIENTHIKNISHIYETEPVGYLEQDRFLNMVTEIETLLAPLDLLKQLQQIEAILKRVRNIRWGPRNIDIDILLYDNVQCNYPELIIPHPRMFQRAFVLIPLNDLLRGSNVLGQDIDSIIMKCDDYAGVRLYKRLTVDQLR